MIDINEDLDPAQLVDEDAEAKEQDEFLGSNEPLIIVFNEAVAKGKAVCSKKRSKVEVDEYQNEDKTYIFSNPFQGYHMNVSFIS